jgi:hypothetical protein
MIDMDDLDPRFVEELLIEIRRSAEWYARREIHLLVDFGGMNTITSLRGRPVVDVVASL